MANIIQLRRDTAANWTSANPILADGEAGWETDTQKLKIGDGSSNWSSLSYFEGSASVDLTNYVDKTSNEDIGGLKTFTSAIIHSQDGMTNFIAIDSIPNQNRIVSTNNNGTNYTYLEFDPVGVNNATIYIPNQTGRLITDAPNDGERYVREAESWVIADDSSLSTTSTETADFNASSTMAEGLTKVNSSSDVTITVQDFATSPIPVGSVLVFMQEGEGNILVAYSGSASGDNYQTHRKGNTLTLWHESQDSWTILNPPSSIDSRLDLEPTGAYLLGNIVGISQADYDAGTPLTTTTYLIE